MLGGKCSSISLPCVPPGSTGTELPAQQRRQPARMENIPNHFRLLTKLPGSFSLGWVRSEGHKEPAPTLLVLARAVQDYACGVVPASESSTLSHFEPKNYLLRARNSKQLPQRLIAEELPAEHNCQHERKTSPSLPQGSRWQGRHQEAVTRFKTHFSEMTRKHWHTSPGSRAVPFRPSPRGERA